MSHKPIALLALVVAAALLFPAMTVMGIPTYGPPDVKLPYGAESPETGFSSEYDLTPQQIRDRIQNMTEFAQEKRMFGMFDYDDGVAEGHFVKFSYNETTGELTNYSVRTGEEYDKVFQSVIMNAFAPDDYRAAGSVFNQWNDTHRMVVHNNPTAMINGHSNTTSTVASFLLNDSMEVEEIDMDAGDRKAVRIHADGLNASISVANGTIDIDNSTDDVYVNVTANEGMLLFRMMPFFAGDEVGPMLSQAVNEGKVSNELAVLARDGNTLSVENVYDPRYSMEMVEAGKDKISLELSSEDPEGRVMIIVFDDETLNTTPGISVKLNDEEITEADIEDVLASTGNATTDSVYALIEENGTQYLVAYIPHFSTQTLDIETVSVDEDDDGYLMLVAVAAIVVVAAVLFLIKRGSA